MYLYIPKNSAIGKTTYIPIYIRIHINNIYIYHGRLLLFSAVLRNVHSLAEHNFLGSKVGNVLIG